MSEQRGLNTNGLNGSGKFIADVANHAALVLAARLMALFGVPIAMWLFIQVWDGQAEALSMVRDNRQDIAVHSVQIGEYGRRLTNLEQE